MSCQLDVTSPGVEIGSVRMGVLGGASLVTVEYKLVRRKHHTAVRTLDTLSSRTTIDTIRE